MSNTNEGTINVTAPSTNPGSESPRGNGGNGSNSQGFSASAQAVAIPGNPVTISVIDNLWGFTLSTAKSLSNEIETALAGLLRSAPKTLGAMAEVGIRTGLWGLALQGILPSKIAKDDPAYMAHVVSTLPADKMTGKTPQQISVSTDVPVHAQIQDSISNSVQTIGLVTAPGRVLTAPVVKAKPTNKPNVFTAKIHPDMPDVHITIDKSTNLASTTQPALSKAKDGTAREATVAPGGNTVDAFVHFESGNHAPIYVAMTKILTPAEIKSMQDEITRRQKQWDATHPVEAANRKSAEAAEVLKNATQSLANAKNRKEKAQASVSAAGINVQKRTTEVANAKSTVTKNEAEEKKLASMGMAGLPPSSAPGHTYHLALSNLAASRRVLSEKQSLLDKALSEQKSANSENQSAQIALNSSNDSRNKAEQSKKDADKNRDKVKEENKGKPAKISLVIDDKIKIQLPARGWTVKDIEEAVSKGPMGVSVDQRRPNKTPDKLGRSDPANVYGSPGKYVIVNDRTGEVTQVSDKTDPNWIDDSRIVWGKK